jgi:hypothetical protein
MLPHPLPLLWADAAVSERPIAAASDAREEGRALELPEELALGGDNASG